MKPIVIAGNGPSLADINYQRVPEDFDCYRVNQFFFEDKYYLGKKITAAILAPTMIQHLFYTIFHLDLSNEYKINEYLSTGVPDNSPELDYWGMPRIPSVYLTYQKNNFWQMYYQYYLFYYNKGLNAGTVALTVAILRGYKNIYLSGIDLYSGKNDYAYAGSKTNFSHLYEKLHMDESFWKPENFHKGVNNFYSAHSVDLEIQTIKILASTPEVKIYSISDSSPINEYIPLAPILEKHFAGAQDKPDNATKDILLSPRYLKEKESERMLIQKIKQCFIDKDMANEWHYLRSNIWLRLLVDALKPMWIFLKIVFHSKH